MRVSGHRISIVSSASSDSATSSSASWRFWQVAVLTAAGVIGSTAQSDAALYYWQDNDPGYYRPMHPVPQRKRARRAIDKKSEKVEKETTAKPVGPLVIAISIDKQRVRIHDANGFFAESPISTGMKGHPTPMGVFSIIQKHKMHHSNIYSGAPMPFMQRITWSGVAMHAGVLPGYPASHGCIRMPMAFAQKMWIWTRMGARVVVTPGEMTPASFSHPLLVTQKAVPVANDAPQVDAPLGVKSDKGADARPATNTAAKPIDTAETNLELRSTVGHASLTQTADASGAIPANAAVTMSDASPAAASGEAISVKAADVAETAAKPETAKADEAKAETAKSEAEQVPAKSVDTAASEEKPAESKPAEIVTGEIKPAETTATDSSTAKAEATAKAEEKPGESKTEATAEAAKPETPKVEAAKVEEAAKPETATDKPAPTQAVDAPDAKKDPARLPGVEKAAKAEPKREGQVAVFISRKDGKLYMRQNFKPVFDMPVTIAPSDRLLGTHVFTAQADKNDPNLLRWSVISLPVAARNAQKSDEDERASRRRKVAGVIPAETKPLPAPNSPAEALDRITVPPEAMARITEALTTGASIVVSDQGINGGETGEGTDFIVRLR
jgi:lipoprotein-anchoring transpeptidase ErfK/SrfK